MLKWSPTTLAINKVSIKGRPNLTFEVASTRISVKDKVILTTPPK